MAYRPDRITQQYFGLGARLVLLAVALVVAVILLWQIKQLLLLMFGSVLVAVLLRSLADLFRDWTPIGPRLSLTLAAVIILLFIAGFVVLLGAQIQTQMAELFKRLPELIEPLERWLGIAGLEEWIAARAKATLEQASLVSQMAGYSSIILSVLANTLLVLVAGIYLAARPRFYAKGILMLFPENAREEAEETLTVLGRSLRLWLLGQLLAMFLVGAVTAVGLWLLGIPSALALGFIAGMLEFVPFIGPIVAAVPGIAVALGEGGTTVFWVGALYLVVQQAEGYLITPLIQEGAVDLPPALLLFAIVAFGVFFGPLGILFATPLAVVVFILVKKLWIRDTLHEETELPGDDEEMVEATK
jgi:predicted PurR-regulated permease PerM